ncbi:hypothetical protein [Streptomyces niveus]|uniref:Uncharacterized protein n=1 Tax=Streptomyces niveus TaxID=193462 RepID=A0A1U9R165_STRNV|nr:hypothetical protein [Streptomyces niveus]AQU64898.1 hypothetical protein BBN63_00040 [Streptomyces niveus]AQU70167.1 hypothetical protein BBN63_32310 [Streptomyces niveus]
MANLADEYGTDVEIYRKALSDTVHADTPTGAPETLLALLDQLGLERHTVETGGPAYIWHEVPGRLDEDAKKQLATRAVPALLMAGYIVNIPDDLFDPDAFAEAARDIRPPAPGLPETAQPVPPSQPATGATAHQRRGA